MHSSKQQTLTLTDRDVRFGGSISGGTSPKSQDEALERTMKTVLNYSAWPAS